jgi:rRNA maturation protein Nop10
MSKLRRCEEHHYTLESICPKCGKPTESAHNKFPKLKDAKEKED